MRSIMALKFKSGRQSHEKGLFVYFRPWEIFFYLLKRQRCRVSMTKHRQQSNKPGFRFILLCCHIDFSALKENLILFIKKWRNMMLHAYLNWCYKLIITACHHFCSALHIFEYLSQSSRFLASRNISTVFNTLDTNTES